MRGSEPVGAVEAAGWGGTAGQREAKTRGKVAGCIKMPGGARMSRAEHSERRPACYAERGVLAGRMQCVGEEGEGDDEEEEEEEEKGLVVLGGRNVKG